MIRVTLASVPIEQNLLPDLFIELLWNGNNSDTGVKDETQDRLLDRSRDVPAHSGLRPE